MNVSKEVVTAKTQWRQGSNENKGVAIKYGKGRLRERQARTGG